MPILCHLEDQINYMQLLVNTTSQLKCFLLNVCHKIVICMRNILTKIAAVEAQGILRRPNNPSPK